LQNVDSGSFMNSTNDRHRSKSHSLPSVALRRQTHRACKSNWIHTS